MVEFCRAGLAAFRRSCKDDWCPWIIYRNVINTPHRNISNHNHHVSSTIRPVPGECKRLLFTVNLVLHLIPSERCVGSGFEIKAIFVELRPTSVQSFGTGLPQQSVRTNRLFASSHCVTSVPRKSMIISPLAAQHHIEVS